MIQNLDDLNKNSNRIIFSTIVGSHAYGTNTDNSDVDIKGIYFLKNEEYLEFKPPAQQVADEKSDTVYYTLKRFMQLSLEANPNVLELLYMPNDCIKVQTDISEYLIKHRDLFMTKLAYDSHINYALSQIKRAKGRNKLVNNPQHDIKPNKTDFCWVIGSDKNEIPFRPIKLSAAKIDLSQCHIASLEHSGNMYRLYFYGESAKGVFRDDQIVCESIPKEDEMNKNIGILIYNAMEYKKALKNYKNYQHWKKNRNEERWIKQESGELDYDSKNMMHTFRLLFSGKHIISHGEPKVRFEGSELEFLMDIRNGNFNYEELTTKVEDELDEIQTIFKNCSLPDKPDIKLINSLFFKLNELWTSKRDF
ncbi:MAG: hypothetical protein COA79_09180 [Planctomycetota bacterium]|nr:MAG: hypothetical protein COA79_09180 [Planctomycetota bacterium]